MKSSSSVLENKSRKAPKGAFLFSGIRYNELIEARPTLLKDTTMKSFEMVVNVGGMKIYHYVEAVDSKAAKAQGLADFEHLDNVKITKVVEG